MADLELPLSALWNHRRGELLCQESAFRVLFAIDSRSSRLVTMLPGSAAHGVEGTLCIPDDTEDSLQLLVQIEPTTEDESPTAADRFAGYHGSGHRGILCVLEVAGGKIAGIVLDPGDIPLENPLLAHEGRLLKVLNGDRARLQAMVNRRLGTTLHDALAVGIDPRGIDIRATEGVFRITFVKFAEQPAAAEARIADLFAV
jgi:hypothetical protein